MELAQSEPNIIVQLKGTDMETGRDMGMEMGTGTVNMATATGVEDGIRMVKNAGKADAATGHSLKVKA